MAQLRNLGSAVFSAAQEAQVGDDATHFGLWGSENGSDFLQGGVLSTDTPPLALNQNYIFAARALVISMAASAASRTSDAAAQLYLAGLVVRGAWVSLHDGDPENRGLNELNIPRIFLPASSWEVVGA